MPSTEPIPVPRAQLFFARLMRATPGLWTSLGNLETRTLGRELDGVRIEQPIFVTGLARSGTTIVTELLNRHPDVTSHRYSDFPLVWTPYWWNALRSKLPLPESTPAERSHQDRLQVTPDSPEAVEEVIWMRFFEYAHDPGVSQVLDGATENGKFERFYQDHIRKLLLVRGAKRYLAKGNYNLTRLTYLRHLFPDARFVIMVRDPVWHIASLIKQDRLFCEQHANNPKVTEYLKLLGHYEFGVHKQPINTGDETPANDIGKLWDSHEPIRGWAVYWSSLYRLVHEQLNTDNELADACLVVKYEELCAYPRDWTRRILEHCRLEAPTSTQTFGNFVSRISAPEYYEPGFSVDQRRLIAETSARTAQQFGYAPTTDS